MLILNPQKFGIACRLAVSEVPPHLHDGLVRYLVHHIKPGGFLTSVLENNLWDAISYADSDSLAALEAIVHWIYRECPVECRGSPRVVTEWLNDKPQAHTATP